MLATGEIVTGAFFGGSATFVPSDRDVSYRVWSEHPDGVFRVRNSAYRGDGLSALIAADRMWWSHAPSCSMAVVVTPYGVMCPLEECRVHTDDWRVIAELCAADAAKRINTTTEPARHRVSRASA